MQQQRSGGRGKAYLFLGISLGAAFLSSVLIIQVLKRTQAQLEEARKPPETVEVVIAARTLYMGVPIRDEDIHVRAVLPDMVPGDHVFTSADLVVGRTPKERILPNEVIRSERLARIEDGVGLNAVITPGKRAMAVAVSAEAAVAGLIEPLNFVDVVGVAKPDDTTNKKPVANTILENIKVLALGSQLSTRPEGGAESEDDKKARRGTPGYVRGKRTVTLEVTPEEGHKLALAAAEGEIHLMLRADTDIVPVDPVIVSINDVIGWSPTKADPKPSIKGRPRVISQDPEMQRAEVVSGSDVSKVVIDEKGGVTEVNRGRNRR